MTDPKLFFHSSCLGPQVSFVRVRQVACVVGRVVVPFLLLVMTASIAMGQGYTDDIVQTGDPAPDANGTFSFFGPPVLNNSGAVAFGGILNGTSGGSTDDRGIFRGSGGTITQIAREGQAAPDANGMFSGFNNPLLNDSGAAAFIASLAGTNDDVGIFRGSGGTIVQIARKGQAAPDANGRFFSFGLTFALNDSGAAAFWANLIGTSGGSTDDSGIFRGSGGAITQIAREGQAAPDANGSFSSFFGAALSDSGAAAFKANLIGTSGGSTDNSGIFRGSGGAITQIVREGQAAPDANGSFSNFGAPVLNDVGAVAFSATLNGTSGSTDGNGVFRGSGGNITQIARGGQAAPNANGTFFIFNSPALNDVGAVAFFSTLTGTNDGSTDANGVFLGSGGSITQIARGGQAAPDANGILSSFQDLALNDYGTTAFHATLTGTSNGSTDDTGIFLADSIDLIQAARRGDIINGSAITWLNFSPRINNFGQVAYTAELANGDYVIRRFTPDLQWRATSGYWDDPGRWTLGLSPALVHDTLIDPDASLTIFGPTADTTVRSLQIGGGSGLATLRLQTGSTLTATNGVTIASTGTLTGDGTIAGDITNGGTIIANNVTVASTLTNNRIIRGFGRIHANVVNSASGEVRANNGDSMWLSGPSFSNAGLVEVHTGELRVSATVDNASSTGLISVRDGSLIAENGIINRGGLALTSGTSTVRGDINNTGIMQVSGGAHATFFDDLTQNGTMQVSKVGDTNSVAVVLGALSGSGGFTGGGDLFALGDLRPGNSPDSVLMDGNLFLGNNTHSFFELGGSNLGEFDQLLVTGDLNLAGGLSVDLIDGFGLSANQEFLIADVGGSLIGQFNGFGDGDLVGNYGGRDLFISYTAGTGNDVALFTAVPEPGWFALCIMGLMGAVRWRRRQSHWGCKPANTRPQLLNCKGTTERFTTFAANPLTERRRPMQYHKSPNGDCRPSSGVKTLQIVGCDAKQRRSYPAAATQRTRRWQMFLVAAVVFGSVSIPSVANADLVTNGKFDVFVPNNATGGGWTSANTGGGGWRDNHGVPLPSFLLNDFPNIVPTLTQSINGFVPGTLYTVSGDYALHFAGVGPSEGSFELRIDGEAILALGPGPSPNSLFDPFSASFLATSTTHTLQLATQVTGDYDYYVDNISVNASVPEPGTMAITVVIVLCAAAQFGYRSHKPKSC